MEAKKSKIFTCFSLVLFVVASVYSFVQEFYGIEFPDTFYYASQYITDCYVDVTHLLSQWLFVGITNIFGHHIIALRLFNWLFYYGACLIALGMALYVYRSYRYLIFLAAAVSATIIPAVETTAWNGNAMSTFFIVALCSSIYLTINRNPWWLVSAVIVSVLGILARFPNIVLVPIVLAIMPLIGKPPVPYFSFVGAMVCVVLIYIGVNIVVFGSLDNFVSAWHLEMTRSTDTSAADHSLTTLMEGYLHTLKDIVSYLKIMLIFSIFPIVSLWLSNKWGKVFLIFVGIAGCVLMCMHKANLYSVYHCTIILMVLNIIPLLVAFLLGLIRHDREGIGWPLLFLGLFASASAGADSGLCYMSAPLLAYTPWIWKSLYESIKFINKKECVVLEVSMLYIAGCAAVYVRNGLQWVGVGLLVAFIALMWFTLPYLYQKVVKLSEAKMLIHTDKWMFKGVAGLVAIGMIVIPIHAKLHLNIDEQPLNKLTCTFTEPQLCGLRSNAATVNWVGDVMRDYRVVENKPVVFYGYMAGVFNYMTGKGWNINMDFSQKENARNMAAFTEAIANYPVVFICPMNPGIRPLYDMDSYPAIQALLTERGYRVDKKSYHIVYYPPIVP